MDCEKRSMTYIKEFLNNHYDYTYLKGMLRAAREYKGNNATLVTGSSHSLCGFDSNILKKTFNCSMHSQDIYYDFKCGKNVLDGNSQKFSKCYIVMGYYIPCQDLSRASKVGREMITKVYYPIFEDAHHLTDFEKINMYEGIGISEDYALKIEQMAIESILKEGSYYGSYKSRKPYLKFEEGLRWHELSEEIKVQVGEKRASDHNRIKYRGSFLENIEIFKDYIHYLALKDVKPIVVVTPYTKYYNAHVDKELKEMFLEVINAPNERIDFVDLNEWDCFEDYDFVDTDHLNENGAKKVSSILMKIFK